jgi:hypothetical protein
MRFERGRKMQQAKENTAKLKAAGLLTDFALARNAADIDRLVNNAKESLDVFGKVNGQAKMIIEQAEQAKKVLFND